MPNITARDVSSVLGLNKYETAWQLMENKIESKYPFFGNKFTEHGKKFESVAIKLYEKLLGNSVNTNQKNLKHPNYKWLTGRLDGITENNCVIEVKCPWNKKHCSETIPAEYWIQCQIYMNLVNAEIAHYVEYHVPPDSPTDGSVGTLHYLPVIRDRAWFDSAIPKLVKFHEELTYWSDKGSLDDHPIRKQELIWRAQFEK